MLPKNKLGANFPKFKCICRREHKHAAQKPKTVNLNDLKVMGVIHKIGRRKTAVARVYVSEGTGKITVNKKNSQLIPNCYFTIQSNATNVYDRKCN
jgi:hypothetical protein